MALNDFPLLIDLSTGNLVRDFESNVEPALPPIRQGDTLRLKISGLRPNSNPLAASNQPWEYADVPTNLRVGVGIVGAAPEFGTFTLDFEGDETGNLNYNASASDIQSALSGLTSITSAGGVTVTGNDGGPWQVVFSDVGGRSDIVGDGEALYPATLVTVTTRRNGTVDLREVQIITLERQPAAYTDSFTNFPSAAVSVTTLQEGAADVPEVQRVTLSPIPYGGTFTLTRASKTSSAIPYNATAEELKAALGTIAGITPDDPETEDTDESDVQVTGAFPSWDITFGSTLTGNQSVLSGSASGLLVPTGKIGELDLNTEIIGHILGSESELSVTLEIESADEPYTILRETVTLQNDLIPNNPNAPGQTDAFYTKTQSDARFTHQSVVPDTLPSAGQILVGNAGGTAYEKKTVSSDATLSSTGALTIANDAVTNAKAANMAQNTIKGRVTASTGDPEDLSAAQLVSIIRTSLPVELQIACSDTASDLTIGTGKVTFRMPHAMTLTGVRASVNTAPAGSTIIVDINEAGSTILSTKLSIDASEKTSTTAASAAVISDTSLADDAEITIDIDQVGSSTAGKGLVVTLLGTRA